MKNLPWKGGNFLCAIRNPPSRSARQSARNNEEFKSNIRPMNNAQLRIRIDSLQTQLSPDGKLSISGQCSFKFFDHAEHQVRSLLYRAYGQTAMSVQEVGVGSIFVASGYINVYKPNPEGEQLNPTTVFTIQRACYFQSMQDAITFSNNPSSSQSPAVTPASFATGQSNGNGSSNAISASPVLF
ncbi:hypothetical protein [Lusitaniella coriacea]|uniref:hypothetical protein n=1 Tax=Lusitaniella coriacea TaxID=1983105 RepID=UPI003CFB1FF9